MQLIRRREILIGIAAMAGASRLQAGLGSEDAKYIGGTLSITEGAEGKLATNDPKAAKFSSREGAVEIPYDKITSLEYGQKAGRRVGVAIMVSPLALFSKKRRHYLTIGWKDVAGANQAAVFELGKDITRGTLLAMQTRSGKQVEYESDEAKKHVGN